MKGTMLAQVFYEAGKMRLCEEQIPQINENELLVKVKACAICGSDLSYYYGNSPLGTPDGKGPLYLGHEICGEVVEVGARALKRFQTGDRVAINPVQQCNACAHCLRGEINVCSDTETIGVSVNGGMAEYVKVRYTHAYRIPEKLSYEEGALTEPLACATHGIDRLDIENGQDVVIFGPGPIGLLMVQLAKNAGAGRVVMVGRRDYPLGVARQLGADFVVNTADPNSPDYAADAREGVLRALGGVAPRAIVATSNMAALQDSLRVTGACSTIVFFGLPGSTDMLSIPMLEAVTSERTFKCASLAPFVWDRVMNMLESGRIQLAPLITHRFALKDAEAGIRFMKESRENKVKGIILPE